MVAAWLRGVGDLGDGDTVDGAVDRGGHEVAGEHGLAVSGQTACMPCAALAEHEVTGLQVETAVMGLSDFSHPASRSGPGGQKGEPCPCLGPFSGFLGYLEVFQADPEGFRAVGLGGLGLGARRRTPTGAGVPTSPSRFLESRRLQAV